MSDPLAECSKCGNTMVRISEENSSPLIVECQNCRHREYAEVQITPPWQGETGTPTDDASKPNAAKTEFRLFDSSAMPVSVGSSDDEYPVIPVGWIILWIIVIVLVVLFIWTIL